MFFFFSSREQRCFSFSSAGLAVAGRRNTDFRLFCRRARGARAQPIIQLETEIFFFLSSKDQQPTQRIRTVCACLAINIGNRTAAFVLSSRAARCESEQLAGLTGRKHRGRNRSSVARGPMYDCGYRTMRGRGGGLFAEQVVPAKRRPSATGLFAVDRISFAPRSPTNAAREPLGYYSD